MTEVKSSSLGNLGLFATKAYTSGDEIVSESPITVLTSNGKSTKSEDEAFRESVIIIG